jgi:hypothetical protein
VRRASTLLAVAVLLTAAFAGLVVAIGAPTPPAAHADGPALTLVHQSSITVASGATVTFTVAVPPGVDLVALTGPAAPPAEVGVTAWKPIDVADAAATNVSTRQRLSDAVAGKLRTAIAAATIPVAGLVDPATGELVVPRGTTRRRPSRWASA